MLVLTGQSDGHAPLGLDGTNLWGRRRCTSRLYGHIYNWYSSIQVQIYIGTECPSPDVQNGRYCTVQYSTVQYREEQK